MSNLILIAITFYGGLIALGFLTKWYIPLVLFAILFGHASHLDWLFLRRKDLRRELNILALQDLLEIEKIMEQHHEEMQGKDEIPGESSSLH